MSITCILLKITMENVKYNASSIETRHQQLMTYLLYNSILHRYVDSTYKIETPVEGHTLLSVIYIYLCNNISHLIINLKT